MSNFVTYAQNFEDLMLWRALHLVGSGFYIDVGAADPDEDSVTRAFYDRGWSGINIEPTPEHFSALTAARPRDITLQCLVGSHSGEGVLHHFADTGLSTTIDTFAGRHVAEGRPETVLNLPLLTLAEICRQNSVDTIHFLKIDVEGGEADVLMGADFSTYRPWIVVVEATEPGSQVENWSGWEQMLLSSRYQFVWFDGLNRFYLAEEHFAELRQAFLTPPNVFDLWVQPRGKQKMALNFAFDKIAYLQSELEAKRQASSLAELTSAKALSDLDRTHAAMIAERAEASHLREQVAHLQQTAVRQGEELTQAQATFAQSQETIVHTQQALAQTEDALARKGWELERVHGDLALTQSALLRESRELSRIREHSPELVRLRGESASLSKELTRQIQLREHTELTLAAVYQSRSWKVSAPLRGIGKVARGQPVLPRLRHICGRVIYRLIKVIQFVPGWRLLSKILRRLAPRLHGALYRRVRAREVVAEAPPSKIEFATQLSTSQSPIEIARRNDVTAEEARILLRLSARSFKA